jgi:hypothetical protein
MGEPMSVINDFFMSQDLPSVRDRLKGVFSLLVKSDTENLNDYYILLEQQLPKIIEACHLLSNDKFETEKSMERFIGLFAHEISTKIAGATSALASMNEFASLKS